MGVMDSHGGSDRSPLLQKGGTMGITETPLELLVNDQKMHILALVNLFFECVNVLHIL